MSEFIVCKWRLNNLEWNLQKLQTWVYIAIHGLYNSFTHIIFYLVQADLSMKRYGFVGYFAVSMVLGEQPGLWDIIVVGKVCVCVCVFARACTLTGVYTERGYKVSHFCVQVLCMVPGPLQRSSAPTSSWSSSSSLSKPHTIIRASTTCG